MERIYAATGNRDKILALIKAALEAIAATFYCHTSELQSGGRFAGKNVMPELTAQFAGVNVTNTPVERAFRLEKKKHKSVESASLRSWRQIRNRLRPGAAASFPPCRTPVHRVIP